MPSSRTTHPNTQHTHNTPTLHTHDDLALRHTSVSRGSCSAEPEVLLATHGERQQSPLLSPLHRIMRIHPQEIRSIMGVFP